MPERAAVARAHRLVPMALFYMASFLASGLQLPFWPTWLQSQGLGSREIGVIVAVSTWVRPLVAPWVGTRADQQDARRRWILRLSLVSCVAAAAFAWVGGFVAILLVTILFAGSVAPLLPLCDSMAQLLVRNRGGRYGRLRLWGSLSFLSMAVASGLLLTPDTLPYAPWLLCFCQVLTIAAAFLLPDLRAGAATGPQHLLIREVLADRRFRALLWCSALLQASHAAYYAFGTMHWRAHGLGEGQIGWLWAEGVLAEIVVFQFVPSIAASPGVARALGIAAVAGIVRWGVTAASAELPALVAVQWLHAATFGLVHLAVVGWIGRHVPAALQSTAQTLNTGFAWGAGIGLAVVACGELYARSGTWAWLAMAALSSVGGCLTLRFARVAGHTECATATGC